VIREGATLATSETPQSLAKNSLAGSAVAVIDDFELFDVADLAEAGSVVLRNQAGTEAADLGAAEDGAV